MCLPMSVHIGVRGGEFRVKFYFSALGLCSPIIFANAKAYQSVVVVVLTVLLLSPYC